MEMFRFNLLLMTVLVAAVFCHEGGHGNPEKWQKIRKCMNETKDLNEFCCPAPTENNAKDIEECKPLAEGIDEKEGKEKHRAYNCLQECAFKTNGLLVDGELAEKDKIKESFKVYLNYVKQPDFEDVTNDAVDYCYDKVNAVKEHMKGHAHASHEGEDKKPRCSWLPTALIGCVRGYTARNCPETKWQTTDECKAKKASATSMDDCMKH